MNDARLMREVAAGDNDALARLYERHAPDLLASGRRLLSRPDAEDVVHDVFVEAWQRAGGFDARRGSVASWLHVRMHSRTIDRARASARRARRVAEHPPPEPASDAATIEAEVDGARVRTWVDGLNSQQKEVARLAYFRGLSRREMAHHLGLPIGTVKSRLGYAMSVLRRNLEPSR